MTMARREGSGPRTRDFCILLKNRLLQKTDVRGPPQKVGTANKANLHCIVDQPITKYTRSRSVGDRVWPYGLPKRDTILGRQSHQASDQRDAGIDAGTAHFCRPDARLDLSDMGLISPIWALRRRSIHSRDWPIPPPIDRGRASDISSLW